jgi:hypothetical protein
VKRDKKKKKKEHQWMLSGPGPVTKYPFARLNVVATRRLQQVASRNLKGMIIYSLSSGISSTAAAPDSQTGLTKSYLQVFFF